MTVTTNAILPPHDLLPTHSSHPMTCYQCNPMQSSPWLSLPMCSSQPITVATNALLPPHDWHYQYNLIPWLSLPMHSSHASLPMHSSHDCHYQCTPPTPWPLLQMQPSHPTTDYQCNPPIPWLVLPMQSSHPMTGTTNAILPSHDWYYQCNPPIPWLVLPMQSSHPVTGTTNATLPSHDWYYQCNPPIPWLVLLMQSSHPMTGTTNAILPSHDWYYQCNPPIPWLVLPMQSSHSVTTNATLLTFCVIEILQGLGCSLRLKQYNTELTDPLLCLLWLKSRCPSPRASRWEVSPMAEQKATISVVFLWWL